MHPEKMSSGNSSPRYTIFNFAKVSVRHRGITPDSVGRGQMQWQYKGKKIAL